MENKFWSSNFSLIGVPEEENKREEILKEMLKLQNRTENNIILCFHKSVVTIYNVLPDVSLVIFLKK